ncbi:hypothetical protein ElyMa_006485600 [Elysia marginata]|uniref:Uncharacterized protein n=1 Tax=Elysia marginata TaxID=1093978 RepID=A0AAV4I367_9GAST|nr:hypothetical protein ElyMa_006485600 [Elysia marginata]
MYSCEKRLYLTHVCTVVVVGGVVVVVGVGVVVVVVVVVVVGVGVVVVLVVVEAVVIVVGAIVLAVVGVVVVNIGVVVAGGSVEPELGMELLEVDVITVGIVVVTVVVGEVCIGVVDCAQAIPPTTLLGSSQTSRSGLKTKLAGQSSSDVTRPEHSMNMVQLVGCGWMPSTQPLSAHKVSTSGSRFRPV